MNAVKCAVDGCERNVTPKTAKGLCGMHYARFRKHGDTSTVMPSGRAAAGPAICTIEQCGRIATYSSAGMCQRHYFRQWRYGTTNLTTWGNRKPKIISPGGYVKLYARGHVLADSSGYVYEHRHVVYAQYGDKLPPCEMCGSALTWANCYVDHIDENPANNDAGNLRPVCCACNIARGRVKLPEQDRPGCRPIAINGESMTASEWARKPGVRVSSNTILRRLKNGASPYDAVFGEKATHTAKLPKVRHLRKWSDPRQ